jgi:hypothetical protein
MKRLLIAYLIAFLSVIFIFSLIINCRYSFFIGQFDDDSGYFASEMERFKKRNIEIPSIVITGGSDVREAWNAKEAQDFFIQRGANLFLLAHSSSGNSIEEQVQIISQLNITNHDLVVMNVSSIDMLNNNPPNLTNLTENLKGYKLIMESKNDQLDRRELSRLFFADFLPYYRKRFLIRKSFSLVKWQSSRVITEKHIYGNKPETEDEFMQKLNLAIQSKIGGNNSLIIFNQNAKLIKMLKDQLKNNLVLVETPRNPMYEKIISPSFKKIAKAYSNNSNIIFLGEGVNLNPKDYYDFNHLHSGGREKFMKKVLVKIENIFRDKIRN